MSVIEIVTELERLGVSLWEESGQLRFRAPKGALTDERRATLRAHKDDILSYLRKGLDVGAIEADPAARYERFPLTDVQSAYLLGRRDTFAYGGVACHAYGELAFADLDASRLERAWQALIVRHDMLRAVVDHDGSQRVLPATPQYRIREADLRGAPPDGVDREIASVREDLDHRVHAPDQWPLFELRVTRGDDRAILHLSIDFLIADYISIYVLLDELRQLYEDPDAALPPLSIGFRDYLVGERRLRGGSRYQRDREYWWGRLDTLPPAPELPLARSSGTARPVRFRRWETALGTAEWTAFGQRARANGLTASGAVLAVYAEVIGRWSRRPRFTLDITLLQRLPLHADVERLVGDFTSVDLLAVEPELTRPFADRAQALQRQLWDDLDHRLCSGIEVMRELARRNGAGAALMPVVFTSAIGLRAGNAALAGSEGFGQFVHGISQTPQVWIDCQAIDRQGALALNWDVREGVFPDGVVDDMFDAFAGFIRRLAARDDVWAQVSPIDLPDEQRLRRDTFNQTAAAVPEALLHEGVVTRAFSTPDDLAVIGTEFALSHAGLLGRALGIRDALRSAGCASGALVAVVMTKGPDQIAAVLGTLLLGAAYLPIDTEQPSARRDRVLSDAGVTYVLSSVEDSTWPQSAVVIDVTAVPSAPMPAAPPLRCAAPDDLAYVIYTSGSTGSPKGVMITHRSALNTIEDINRRIRVSRTDRVLGLSSLGFDLSVYDIFGVLGAGGCLVLPDVERRADPSHWTQLVLSHGVTLWNSVPAQAQMLVDYLAGEPTERVPLRIAMLSGDWIPVALPGQLRQYVPGMHVLSLGGATEAAVWSIYHHVGEVPSHWRSIPYGTPLTNQTFEVLDSALRRCPEWTIGELYIGGIGLAAGYLNDERRTAERFVRHPETGERLYRTGDLGRQLPEGYIEFLGREDSQVKIRGHRIELGEIEAVAHMHPAIARAAVIVDGDKPMERRLAAFVETAPADPQSHCPGAGGDDVCAAASEAIAGVSADVCAQVVAFGQRLDDTALLTMLEALSERGLFRTEDSTHDVEEILQRAEVAPRYHRLIRRWLNALLRHGLLDHDSQTGRYRRRCAVTADRVEAEWRGVDALHSEVDRRTELLDYFKIAGRSLGPLMRGELDPRQLLFPDGSTDVAEVAYHDNFLSRHLNTLLAGATREIVRRRSSRGPCRVLEVGAGIGGASLAVVEALAGADVEYLFTDISPTLINLAREKFSAYPWVKYGFFDLNQDHRSQGLLPNSFDLILCSNTLHYSRNADRTVGRFRELLAPGGWLLFVEMVRDSYPIMTSMEFLLDTTARDFEDVRQGRDETSISREGWFDVLAAADGIECMCLPRPSEPLAEMGLHLFGARFKTDRVPADVASVREHLAARLPEYMLPAHIQIVDSLPLTDNKKIDRGALRAWLPGREQTPSLGEDPTTDLERRLAALWASVLGVSRLARDRDFFAAGGDSLSAAQLVGRLRDEIPEAKPHFFDSLLRVMLEGPTVAKLAAYLESSAGEGDAESRRAASPLVRLGEDGDDAVRLLVHDASGTLASYEDLLQEWRAQGPVAGLVVGDPDAYLGLQSSIAVERTAGDYSQAVRAAGYGRAHVVGYHAGGILALEVARALRESGISVESLTILADCPLRLLIDDDLLAEYLFARSAGIDPVRLGFPAEAGLARALDRIRDESADRIPDGRIATLEGDADLEAVAWSFRRLAGRPAEDRLAAFARLVAPAGAPSAPISQVMALFDIFRHSLRALALHEPSPYAGDLTVVCARDRSPVWRALSCDTQTFWQDVCLGELKIVEIAGDGCAMRGTAVQSLFESLAAA